MDVWRLMEYALSKVGGNWARSCRLKSLRRGGTPLLILKDRLSGINGGTTTVSASISSDD